MILESSHLSALLQWAWQRLEGALDSPPNAHAPRTAAQRFTIRALVEPFSAIAILERATLAERRALLLGLTSRMAPTLLEPSSRFAFQALAERVIAEADTPDADDLWLAFWGGFPPSRAAWNLLSQKQEAALISRWVDVGGATTEDDLCDTLARFLDVTIERVPLTLSRLGEPGAVADQRIGHRLDVLAAARTRVVRFGHTALEHTLLASITPATRLAVMAQVAATTTLNRLVAHTWAIDADPLLPPPTMGHSRALAEVRFAAIAAAAGAASEVSPWLDRALMVASTLSSPPDAAELYTAAFETESCFGLPTWLRAVELALADRRIVNDSESLGRVRRAVVDTWRRLSRGSGETRADLDETAMDRGLDLLRASLRRLPDPWLELRILTQSLELATLAGRDTAGPLAQLDRWSRRPLVLPQASPMALEDAALRSSADSLVATGRLELLGWVDALSPTLRVELLTALALATRRARPC